MLAHPKIRITIANNGEEAIEAFERESFSLIFMDMSMPVMDGKTATKMIRLKETSENRRRTPIICLTAHAMKKHKKEFIAAGMDDYLSKPFKREELLSVMRTWLNAQSKAA